MSLVNLSLSLFIKGDAVSYSNGVITIGTVTGVEGLANPMTTLGDIIYGASAGSATRLSGNTSTTKKFLSQVGNGTISDAPAWSVVTIADLDTIPTNTFLGRITAGTGAIEQLTVTQATSLLNTFSETLKGLVPSGGNSTKFLRGDGTWQAIASLGGNTFTNGLTNNAETNVVSLGGALTGATTIGDGTNGQVYYDWMTSTKLMYHTLGVKDSNSDNTIAQTLEATIASTYITGKLATNQYYTSVFATGASGSYWNAYASYTGGYMTGFVMNTGTGASEPYAHIMANNNSAPAYIAVKSNGATPYAYIETSPTTKTAISYALEVNAMGVGGNNYGSAIKFGAGDNITGALRYGALSHQFIFQSPASSQWKWTAYSNGSSYGAMTLDVGVITIMDDNSNGSSLRFNYSNNTSYVSVYTTSTGGLRYHSKGTYLYGHYFTQDSRSTTNYFVQFTQANHTGQSAPGFYYQGGSHTGLTSGTEVIDVYWALNRTVQRLSGVGTLPNQRAFIIDAPTYSFTGATTITKASTLSITNAPQAGANTTITNSYALDVVAGAVRLGAITNDDALTQILARDSSTGTIKYRDVSSIINNWSTPVTKTSDFSVADGELYLINNKSGSACTVTMPSAGSYSGRPLYFMNYQAQNIVSNASNIATPDGSVGTAMVGNTKGSWALFISDGTNWVMTAYGIGTF